jgi:hypothetical protein
MGEEEIGTWKSTELNKNREREGERERERERERETHKIQVFIGTISALEPPQWRTTHHL